MNSYPAIEYRRQSSLAPRSIDTRLVAVHFPHNDVIVVHAGAQAICTATSVEQSLGRRGSWAAPTTSGGAPCKLMRVVIIAGRIYDDDQS